MRQPLSESDAYEREERLRELEQHGSSVLQQHLQRRMRRPRNSDFAVWRRQWMRYMEHWGMFE